MEGKYVAALDIGTTTVRCHVLDQSTAINGSASQVIEHIYPQIGQDEIEPEELWTKVISVLQDAIRAAGVSPRHIACIGISAQRSSFVTWHKETGKPFHNFITWKDVRADSLVRQWNDSVTMKVTLRLVWALQNVKTLIDAAANHEAMFGTVDTWILYKLTGGRLHVTDVSNASATGFFDPFTMKWANWALRLFQIPSDMLPEVWDTAADFGCLTPDIIGHAIPIRSLVADQAASLFGSCCFEEGDVKVTLGTGTFLNVNTGCKPFASVEGLYPQVGWRFGKEIVYVMEGASHDTGSLINWAQQIGLVSDPCESSDMAISVQDSNGLYFIPAFSGIQAPINNFQAAAGFIGIKPTTSRQHMMRAILESIAFRVVQLFHSLQKEVKSHYTSIRVDGGVSRNDFVTQTLADLTGLKVERPTSSEMSVLGAAFLAGLHAGVWLSKDELKALRQLDRVFEPRPHVCDAYSGTMMLWSQALERFLDWYES
ncbi:glycerol kinase 5 isoform X2 [Periplaneta americana]|uniref:glycerol kinase 5 isoform X2 n=1 Tax=Periplaneta americana TaxID=6978 RepID=UPI0037E70FF6